MMKRHILPAAALLIAATALLGGCTGENSRSGIEVIDLYRYEDGGELTDAMLDSLATETRVIGLVADGDLTIPANPIKVSLQAMPRVATVRHRIPEAARPEAGLKTGYMSWTIRPSENIGCWPLTATAGLSGRSEQWDAVQGNISAYPISQQPLTAVSGSKMQSQTI